MDEKTVNIIVIAFVVLLPIISSTLYYRFLRKRDEFAWEYYKKFLRPKYERGLALGISDERLGELWREALASVVDPTIVGGAPGSRFNALIDLEVEKKNL